MIGGGACAYNPEPMAEFFDIFYIGEVRLSMMLCLMHIRQIRQNGGSRQDFLLKAAQIPRNLCSGIL